MTALRDNRYGTVARQLLGAACAVVLACVVAAGMTGCQPEGGAAGPAGSQADQQQSESASASSGEPASTAGKQGDDAPAVEVAVFDGLGNPTFAGMLDLNGEALVQELEAAGYEWDDEGEAWYRAGDDAVFFAEGSGGTLGPSETTALELGGVNKSASYVFATYGYETPEEALLGLTAEVSVDRWLGNGDVAFAVVANADDRQFLVAVVRDGRGGQVGITFSDASIAAGLFKRLIGADAGNSVSKAWEYCKSVY